MKRFFTIIALAAMVNILIIGCSKDNPIAVNKTDALAAITEPDGTAPEPKIKTINAYLVYDNTVTTSEASGVVRQARDRIAAQFTTAYWTFTYPTTATWSSPSSPYSCADMGSDLIRDFPGYPNYQYHTCIGISRKPTQQDPYGNAGCESQDHAFIDYTPTGLGFNSVASVVMHEWGHSLGAPQCSNTGCVMNTTGCKNGSTTYCSNCRTYIRNHLGI